MRVSRRAVELLAVCVSAAALAGCATVKANVSVPLVPAGSTGKVADEVLHLMLPDLTFSAQIYNYREIGGANGNPPVGVWISLDPANTSFMFDPGLVTLATHGGEPKSPIAIVGPASPWKSPRSVGMGCGPRAYSWGWAWTKMDISVDDVEHGNPDKGVWKRSPGAVRLEKETCFVLAFEVDPNPDQNFVLSVRGATKGGEALPFPDINFSKGQISRRMSGP